MESISELLGWLNTNLLARWRRKRGAAPPPPLASSPESAAPSVRGTASTRGRTRKSASPAASPTAPVSGGPAKLEREIRHVAGGVGGEGSQGAVTPA
eukprot:6952737-Pyramimonas_sp.AAC.1